jgi:hypothetical protein
MNKILKAVLVFAVVAVVLMMLVGLVLVGF